MRRDQAKTIRKKAEPPVLLFKEKTFEHMGMIATMIGGVVHFIDCSCARSIGIAERNVSTTVESNLPELELYGTVHAAHALFAVVGNDAKYPIKGYWLNSDQLMILLMRSSSAKAVEFRRRVVTLIRDLREGRLVYRDNALVAAELRQGAETAHASPQSHSLPFDMSAGLGPQGPGLGHKLLEGDWSHGPIGHDRLGRHAVPSRRSKFHVAARTTPDDRNRKPCGVVKRTTPQVGHDLAANKARIVSPATRKVMQANRRRDTKPEMTVRRWLHARGFRFWVDRKGLPGQPDVVLAKHRLAIFVHGCCWHGHDCGKGSKPKTNSAFCADNGHSGPT